MLNKGLPKGFTALYMRKYILLYIPRAELISFMSYYYSEERKQKLIYFIGNCMHDTHANIGISEISDWKDQLSYIYFTYRRVD